MTPISDDQIAALVEATYNADDGYRLRFDALANPTTIRALASRVQADAAKLDELTDRLSEALSAPWPTWADDIRKKLIGYGVDPGDADGWNIGEDFEGWVDGCIEAETARADAAEARSEADAAVIAGLREEVERLKGLMLQASTSLVIAMKTEDAEVKAALIHGALDFASDDTEALAEGARWAPPVLGGATQEQVSSQSQPVLSPKSDNADGWIEWSGGDCPVPAGTLVDVRYRDGQVMLGIPALEFHGKDGNRCAFNWRKFHGGGCIMAYRLSGDALGRQDGRQQEPQDEPIPTTPATVGGE